MEDTQASARQTSTFRIIWIGVCASTILAGSMYCLLSGVGLCCLKNRRRIATYRKQRREEEEEYNMEKERNPPPPPMDASGSVPVGIIVHTHPMAVVVKS